MFAYGLDRLSLDLDFDATYRITISSIVGKLTKMGNVDIYVKKDSDTTKRITVHFKDENISRPIKLDVSLRKQMDAVQNTVPFTGKIRVYSINELFKQKLKALRNRMVARDLYDSLFMLDEYKSELDEGLIEEAYKMLSGIRGEKYGYFMSLYRELFSRDETFLLFQKRNAADYALTKTLWRFQEFINSYSPDSFPDVSDEEGPSREGPYSGP